MRYFKKLTTSEIPGRDGKVNAVLMGRATWESIPPKFRPLPGRVNCVLSRNPDYSVPDGVYLASSLDDAVSQMQNVDEVGRLFVIGGGQIYQEALDLCDKVYYTQVSNLPDDTKVDAFFPALSPHDWDVQQVVDDKENGGVVHTDPTSGATYRFLVHTAKPSNPEEDQYLHMCRDILERGNRRGDRTGTGTLSLFGTQMRFSLRDGRLPLLTTKRTFWRGVAEELLWFVSVRVVLRLDGHCRLVVCYVFAVGGPWLSVIFAHTLFGTLHHRQGNTNANDLAAKDIHIWDGNGSREFLDSRGLTERAEGDLGPVYGFQWRHFGATYVDMHTDYTGQGVDQLADCIHKIMHNPEDRRIIMSAWNPADLGLMALPPCHMFCQFYVDLEKNEVSCHMYQRSADMGLGVPFNIASYALLTHLVAHVTGRKAGDLVHTIGDAHIYLNHVEALQEQLKRKPRDFPTLEINPDKKGIDDFSYEDFTVKDYHPHKAIKMKMAV
jgi:dihydrofolate reductase/thymidylate synthase